MATYYVTRFTKKRDPQTGKITTVAYREPVQSKTASMFGELQNIKTAAASGKPSVRLASPMLDGKKKTYTATQLQTLKDIESAKKAGADVRQFRTKTNMGMTREQEALTGAIDIGTGFIKLGEVVEFSTQEKEVQKTLEPIRQRRRQQAQAQASLLRRGRGRATLMSSPRGGTGFFGGYFKG